MNSITYHSDEQVQAMLNKFDEVSTSDNTAITGSSQSIEFACDCGCQKVEHFYGPFHKKCERYFVSLCKQHEITFDDDKETTTPKGI